MSALPLLVKRADARTNPRHLVSREATIKATAFLVFAGLGGFCLVFRLRWRWDGSME